MTRVLVTGASGLIGRAVLAALPADIEVHATSRRAAPTGFPERVTWHRTDLREAHERATLATEVRATHLVHCAWHTASSDYATSPANLDWSLATVDLLRHVAAAGATRAVVTGTCYEYDVNHGFLREGITPLRPLTRYGLAKDATRRLCQAVDGIEVAWARIFHTFGPGESPDRVVPYVIRQVLAGRVASCGPGRQLRDVLPSDQVGSALAALLTSDVAGSLNVCSGEPVRLAEILTAAAAAAGDPSLLSLDTRPPDPDEPPLVVGDHRRLTNDVGWTPTRSWVDALPEVVSWWRLHDDYRRAAPASQDPT